MSKRDEIEYNMLMNFKATGPDTITVQRGTRMIKLGTLIHDMHRAFGERDADEGMAEAAYTAFTKLVEEIKGQIPELEKAGYRMRHTLDEGKRLKYKLDTWGELAYQCVTCQTFFTKGDRYDIPKKEVEDDDYCECCGRGERDYILVDVCPVCKSEDTIERMKDD